MAFQNRDEGRQIRHTPPRHPVGRLSPDAHAEKTAVRVIGQAAGAKKRRKRSGGGRLHDDVSYVQLAFLDQPAQQHAQQRMLFGRKVFEQAVVDHLVQRPGNQTAARPGGKGDAPGIVGFQQQMRAGERESDEPIAIRPRRSSP